MASTGRVAVVTGSNKGIGFAVVRALCKQVDNGIIYLTSRDEGRGKAAIDDLKKEGLNPRFHQLDINDPESISRLRDHLVKEHGGLDILVNNAAIAFKVADPTPFAEQARVSIATNYTATVAVCDTLIPIMRCHGRVSTVAAVNGCKAYDGLSAELKGRFRAAKNREELETLLQEFVSATKAGKHSDLGWSNSAYGISKLGRIVITKIQADEIQKDKSREGILINCCCPGFARTDMSNNKGLISADEGAVNPAYLALLPHECQEPHGKMVVKQKIHDFW